MTETKPGCKRCGHAHTAHQPLETGYQCQACKCFMQYPTREWMAGSRGYQTQTDKDRGTTNHGA